MFFIKWVLQLFCAVIGGHTYAYVRRIVFTAPYAEYKCTWCGRLKHVPYGEW